MRSSKNMPEVRPGDVVRIHRKIKEGGKERVQVFEGIVISTKGKQSSSPMITVRRVSFGVGVEIIVPLLSPAVEKIETVKRARTRKAKLYYLRRKDFKLSKLRTRELEQFVEEPAEVVSGTGKPEETEEESAEKESTEKKGKASKDNS